MSATAIKGNTFLEATLTAVILYDDSSVASKVTDMLARSARRAHRSSRWEIEPWRLDMLAMPETKNVVLKSAIESHLLVLAIRNHEKFEQWFFDWLETWAVQRQIDDVAFAVVDAGNGVALSVETTAELTRFADRHGLSFMLGDAGMAEDDNAISGRTPANEDDILPAFRRMWDEPSHSHQGWGINE